MRNRLGATSRPSKSRSLLASLAVAALASLTSLLLLTAGTNPALANAIASTSPAVGAVLAAAPNAVSVSATGTLLTDGNTLSVTDPSGAVVDDGSLTISDTTAVVGLKPLTVTGIYTVAYTLLSATDAPLTGTFTFLFNAPAAISSPSTSPAPSVSTPSQKPAKAAGTSSSANVAVIALFVIATLVGLFLVWYARMIWSESKSRKRKKSAPRTKKKSE